LEEQYGSSLVMKILAGGDSWRLLSRDNDKFNQRRNAFRILALRKYWSRLWIVQEIMLAKDIIILCGNEACDWKVFCAPFYDPFDIYQYEPSTATQRLLNLKMEHKMEWRLVDLLYALGNKQKCEDPRDQIFGLLGVVMLQGQSKPGWLSADYSMSEEQVYEKTMLHMKFHGTETGTGCLYSCGHFLEGFLQIQWPQ
jgi:hypothetical protein